MEMLLASGVGTVLGVVGIIIILVILILTMWRKAPQDKAIIVTGLKKRIIQGGGGLVIPFFEQTDTISLENMSIDVDTNGSLDKNGVPIITDGVAVIKIKTSSDEYIYEAMEQFNTGKLDTTIDKIIEVAKGVLEGKLREIISKMTVEEIYQSREEFANQVEEVATPDLLRLGLEIKAFTIRNISDNQGYLKALGAAQIADVKKAAAIAEADAEKERMIKTSESKRLGTEAAILAETQIAESSKNKELKIQSYKAEQEHAKAKADAAYQIEENIAKQDIIKSESDANLLEVKRKTEIAEQEAVRKEKELESSIRKQADAERYRIEKQADASRYAVMQKAEAEKKLNIAQAEAAAEKIRLEGEARAKAVEAEAKAQAEKIRLSGMADAEVIKAKGLAQAEAIKAEAEAMEKKAEAYQKYGNAAIVEMLASKLPEIAESIASPLAKTEKMVIIDNGGSDGKGAASKVTKSVSTIMSQLPEVVESLTGVNLQEIASSIIKGGKSSLEEKEEKEEILKQVEPEDVE